MNIKQEMIQTSAYYGRRYVARREKEGYYVWDYLKRKSVKGPFVSLSDTKKLASDMNKHVKKVQNIKFYSAFSVSVVFLTAFVILYLMR